MRPGQQQNKRMRGRGRKGPNPMSRSYESNGPDVKIRGTAQHVAEKYITLARDASASGDRVMAENYLQHAEHYGRIVAAAQGTFQLQRDDSDLTDDDEDGDEEGGFEGGANGHAYPMPGERMREDRPQGQNPQGQNPQGQMRETREERGNRDFRDGNRENRDGNRENRDGNRENRDGNREARFSNNRDDRPNNRDDRPRDRTFNRDGNRDGNRNFRNDDRQNRDRATPVGLGPQPDIDAAPQAARSEEVSPAPYRETPVREERVNDERPAMAFEPSAPEAAVPSGADDAVGNDEAAPRRRGRPRRVRLGEEAAALAAAAAPAEAFVAPAEAPVPVAEAEPAEGEKVKRRPGRPRKKKAEEGGEEPSGLPDFLLASNG